jgi:5-methylcytosine-specific restriction protein A
MININIIQEALENGFGICFSVETGSLPDRLYCKTRPTDLESGRGFYIQSNLRWRTLGSSLAFEEFSRPFAQQLGDAPVRKKQGFLDFLSGILTNGKYSAFKFRINDHDFTHADPNNHWYSFELFVEQSPINIDFQHETAYIADQQKTLLEALLLLMDLEPVVIGEIVEVSGLPEGALCKVEVNKYERNRFNRDICIRVNGAICKVCGFNFEETYGAMGNGFIHVHHITPISKIGPDYIINPIKDLMPVCPNCHAMLHRENPPITLESLKNILLTQKVFKHSAFGEL